MHPQTDELISLKVSEKVFQNSKEVFPSLLKYIQPTSIKIFNIISFLCSFWRTISEYFVILLCYRSTKRRYFCHLSQSRIIFSALAAEFHLDPSEGLKALFICSSGKGFSSSLKLILTYFKDLLSTSIIHLPSCDPKTIPIETESFPKSTLAACFRQGGRQWPCY